jgi:hypothetical protein
MNERLSVLGFITSDGFKVSWQGLMSCPIDTEIKDQMQTA